MKRLLGLALLVALINFGVLSPGSALPLVSDSISGRNNPKTKAAWTILVYANAKNNLAKPMIQRIQEMERVGSTEQVKILLELGIPKSPVRRYFITRSRVEGKRDDLSISSPIISEKNDVDMGSADTLASFVQWGQTNYPAEHFMLVICGHGNGWKGFSFDYEAGSAIDLLKLAPMLSRLAKFDILWFDMCYMQMAEVGYELRNSADIIVASEETLFPCRFREALSQVTAMPDMDREMLADRIVKSNIAYWEQTPHTGPMLLSAIRTSKLEAFAEALDAWAEAVLRADEADFTARLLRESLSFYQKANYFDLYTLMETSEKLSANDVVKATSRTLKKLITQELILTHGIIDFPEDGRDYSRTRGIAIDFPATKKAGRPWYYQLALSHFQNWHLLHRAVENNSPRVLQPGKADRKK